MKKVIRSRINHSFPLKLNLKMRITTLLLLVSLFQLHANDFYGQKTKVSLNLKNVSLETVLNKIESLTEFKFIYKDKQIDYTKTVSIKAKKETVSKVLNKLFLKSKISFSVNGKQIILKPLEAVTTSLIKKETIQKTTISGLVLDNTGQPLPGASLLEKGTNNGTETDFDGKYSISVKDENATLVISYIGFKTKEIAVNGKIQINVTLEEDAGQLDEIVVVGYGSQSKAKVANAISTIKAAALLSAPIASIDEGLAGQLAGVQIIQESGAPGGNTTINIRGVGTLTAGSKPLIVVDGFPSEDFSLSTLNPNSIESIDILKDAASAAIYGSRGSNGVVLVTTKKGKGEMKVTYDGFTGIQSVAKTVNMQDAYERGKFVAQALINSGKGPSPLFQPYADGIPGLTNTNWQDEIFRNASIQSHNISLSGASEKMDYFVSAGFFDQEGIVIGSDFQRFNFRANLNFDISEKFRAGFKIAPTFSQQNKVSEGDHKGNGVVLTALIANPAFSPYNSDGSLNLSGDMILGARANGLAQTENPVALALLNEDKVNSLNMLSSGFLEFEPIDGLTFKTYVGAQYTSVKEKLFSPETVGSYKVLAKDKQATGAFYTGLRKNWISENTVSYKTVFNEDHNFNALIGQTFQTESTESSFPSTLSSVVVNQSGVNTTVYPLFEEKWSLISYLGRVNYDYNSKYIVGASIRRDGSSRFGKNTKWGWFPSVSAAWRVSKEDFFKSEVVNELKLRGSWGITGNNSIPNYGAIPLLGTANYGTSNGSSPLTAPNENLSWEQTSTLDIGLDIGFFDNKMSITTDYYKAVTNDLLLNVPVPAHSGNTSSLRNIGKVQNSGFEFAIKANEIKLGNVEWSSTFNISTNKNEVLELGPGQNQIVDALHITQVGKPIGSYYLYRLLGVFETQDQIDNAPTHPEQELGDYRFADLNGDGKISADDREISGDFFPDYTFGFANTFKYKNFDFNFALQGKQGFEIYNGTGFFIRNLEGWGNGHADINNYYSATNPSGPYAHPGKHVKTYERSKLLVEDGSYIRLRSISLGYTLPNSISDDTFFSKLKVYVSAKNLFTITDYSGYNPEVSSRSKSFTQGATQPGVDYGAYPVDKSVVLGVKMSF